MCGWCRIFDSASRIFGKSSTVVSDVEFLMQRIKCINYICLHGSRQTGFFSGWSTQMPCAETQALFIMASTCTACNVCCKTTKYTCLDCGLHFCIPCSVFEWRWRGPGMDGWALCSSMWCVFSRAVGKNWRPRRSGRKRAPNARNRNSWWKLSKWKEKKRNR